MIEQRVENPKFTPIQGIGWIALAVIGLYIPANVFALLVMEGIISSLTSSIATLLTGMLVAWLAIEMRVKGYRYEIDELKLVIERTYGRRRRPMAQLLLRQIIAVGTPESIQEKYPQAKVRRATRRRCTYEPLAIAYRTTTSKGVLDHRLILQPEPRIAERLRAAVKA